MNLERKCKQDAVYWANPVPDGTGGHTYDTPEDIKVRWEDRQELFIDADGRERMSNAVVFYTLDFNLGGYLYLGTSADFDSSEDLSNPEVLDNCFKIMKTAKIPNIRGTQFWRKAWL